MWFAPKFLDNYDIPIIYWTSNDKCGIFKNTKNKNHWEWLVEKYSIKYWRTVDSIKKLPIKATST